MIAFAYLDAQGYPTGGGVRPALPNGAVPLTKPFTTADLPRLRFHDGVWELRKDLPKVTQPTPEEIAARRIEVLTQARRLAVKAINAHVGRIRSRIWTDIPGQDALYLAKRAEAVAYVAGIDQGGEPVTLQDFPLLENEIGITAPTPWQLAQIWLHRSDEFRRIGAATERARLQATNDVAVAPDEDAIDTILAAFTEAIGSLTL